MHNELSCIPIQRQLEEQHLEIESIFQQLDNIPKEYLSRQEAETLRARLDALEEALTRNLQETVTDTEELEAKVAVITQDMSVLKDNLSVLSKRGWAKALITRSFEWAKDPANRKMLKSGVEVAKDLLLPGDKPPGT